MISVRGFLLSAVLALQATSAAPEAVAADALAFFDGNVLYARLTAAKHAGAKSTDMLAASAIGFVMGVADGLDGVKHPNTELCFQRPETTNTTEIVSVVHSFLEKHPQFRKHAAASVVAAALDQRFPCRVN
jgi:hypothetical protein